MAKAIPYEVPQPEKSVTAHDELAQLLEALHDTGVLRLANDALRAAPDVSKILLGGLNMEESRNAVQNLSLLAMALGRIPPERFASLTRAFTESLATLEKNADGAQHSPPGAIGAYKLLHDKALWQGLGPLIAAIKGFPGHLQEPPEKPAARRHDGSDATS